MPNTSAALASIIRQLQAERQQHADAIAAIDEQFEQHGITAEPRRRRRTRGSYAKTADQFILGLVKGRKGMTTGQINAKWRQAKRGGTADKTLSKLVGEKKLKRENLKGERGSRYRTG
jgi:hypothetical protein